MRRSSLVLASLVALLLPTVGAHAATPATSHPGHAPAPVSRLRTYDGRYGIDVVWVVPHGSRFDHVVLRYERGVRPPGRRDGHNTRLAPRADSATITGLARHTRYALSIWTVDAAGRRSVPRHARFTTDAGAGLGLYAARYTDSAGHPLAGVVTSATDWLTGVTRRATSGRDGRAALRLPAGDSELQVGGQHITGGVSDTTGYQGIDRFVTIRGGRTTDGGTSVLPAGGAVRIHVVDAAGAPVAGLVPSLEPVNGFSYPTTEAHDGSFAFSFAVGTDSLLPTAPRTGGDGTALIRGVPSSSALRVCAGSDGQTAKAAHATYLATCSATSALARSGHTTDLAELTLERAMGATITGRVRSGDGRGFAGSYISIESGHDYAEAVTDAGGFFRVSGIPAGTYRVCAAGGAFEAAGRSGFRPGCTNRPVKVGGDGSSAAVSIIVRPGAAATGTVTDPSGGPVSGAGVQISGHGVSQYVSTDSEGQFLAKGLAPGTNSICVGSGATHDQRNGVTGNCQRRHRHFVTRPEHVRNGVDVTLPVGGRVTGTVTDSRGTPIRYPFVIAETNTEAGEDAPLTTRPGGRFVLSGLPSGRFRLCAIHALPDLTETSGCSRALPVRRGHAIRHVRIVVPSTSTVVVRTVDRRGRPIAGVDAIVVGRCARFCAPAPLLAPVKAATVAGAITDSSGRVALSGIRPGHYNVCLLAYFGVTRVDDPLTGFADRCVARGFTLEVRVGRSTTVQSVLQPAGAVSGKVTGAAGDPLAGVVVHVAGSTADDVPTDDVFDPDEGTIDGGPEVYSRTASDGTYTIRSVRPGARLVCVDASVATGGTNPAGYQSQCVGGRPGNATRGRAVTVRALHTSVQDLALRPSAGVVGKITLPRGRSVRGVVVTLFSGRRQVQNVEQPRAGTYRFTQLAPGSYVVCAQYFGHQNIGRCYRSAAWSGGTPPASAVPVTVPAGRTVSGIDIAFPR